MRDGNTMLEDVSAVIGFRATTRLVGVFGPGKLLIPVAPHPDHAITLAIGDSAMRRLVAEWGGQVLELCMNADDDHTWLVRGVAAMLKAGMPAKRIAGIVGLTERQVRRLRCEAEEIGLLPLVLRAKGARRVGAVDVMV